MADLFDRFTAEDGTRIPIHAFHAALADYLQGSGLSKAAIVTVFVLDAQASANLDVVIAKIDGTTGVQNKLRVMGSIEALLVLMEHGIAYTTRASFVARFNQITA
jgi:hypothetical protein